MICEDGMFSIEYTGSMYGLSICLYIQIFVSVSTCELTSRIYIPRFKTTVILYYYKTMATTDLLHYYSESLMHCYHWVIVNYTHVCTRSKSGPIRDKWYHVRTREPIINLMKAKRRKPSIQSRERIHLSSEKDLKIFLKLKNFTRWKI